MGYIPFPIHLFLNQNHPQVHSEILQYARHREKGTFFFLEILKSTHTTHLQHELHTTM
jgi:hypothetical protein